MRTKPLLTAAICACALAPLAAYLSGCTITQEPGPTGPIWTIKPAENSKPRPIPPSRRQRHIIDGKCVDMFQAPGGQWYCFPCDIPTGVPVAGEPCNGPPVGSFGPGGPGGAPFLTFIDELLLQEGVVAESEEILEHFGLDTWSAGNTAPIPIAIQLIDTTADFAQIVIISRSDWDWPDDSAATVEAVAFPDATGSLPNLTDGTPDAIAFRVSGTLVDVAESIASISDTGFTWTHLSSIDNNTYTFETDVFPGGSYYTEVRQNNMVIWNNL